jgi:hypothetical protein
MVNGLSGNKIGNKVATDWQHFLSDGNHKPDFAQKAPEF